MSDDKIKDSGDHHVGQAQEKHAITNPEAEQARNASGSDLSTARASNPDASDGSATPKNRAGNRASDLMAGQDGSIEIVDYQSTGKAQILAARKMPAEVFSAKLTYTESGKHQDRPTSNGLPKPPHEATHLQPARHNESPKQTETTKHSEQAKPHEILRPQAQQKPPEHPTKSIFEQIAALPFDKQLQVMGAGINAFKKELDHQQIRIAIGIVEGVGDGTVSLVHGVESLGKSVCEIAQFSRDVMENNPRAIDTAGKVGDTVGKLLVNGVQVWGIAENYLEGLGAASYGGDNTKVFRDVSWLGQQLNHRWQSMTPEEQTRTVTRLAMENLGPIAAAGVIHKVAKSMDVVGALQELGTSVKTLSAAQKEKYGKVISGLVDELAPRPMALTPDGHLMPIPKQNHDHVMFMKGDKGLPAGVKPSEKLIAHHAISPEGRFISKMKIPEEIFKAAEKQGINREAVKEQIEKIGQAVNKAYLAIGKYNPAIHGSERAYGNQFHELLRKNLRQLNDPLIRDEASYLKGASADWGKLGTSRVDISLGKKEAPFVSICLKTLNAVPSAQQERGWVRNLPRLSDGTIAPRLYLKMPGTD